MKQIRKRKEYFRRALSVLLVCLMVLSSIGAGGVFAMPDTDAEDPATAESQPGTTEPAAQSNEVFANEPTPASGGTDIDFSAYQANDMFIYNYLYYTNSNGEITRSGGYHIKGSNDMRNIIIGNNPTGEASTNPLSDNILVTLSGLNMKGTVTVKPVGADKNYKTVLTVSQLSSLGSLAVETDATLELILNGDLQVGTITLGENSRLTVTGTGKLTVTDTFTSMGTVSLGSADVEVQKGISSTNLSLNNTRIQANGQAIAATNSLSMTSSTVTNASLFGYGETNGTKELILTGTNGFSNVTAVGSTATSDAIVSIEGIETVTNSDAATYYRDYTITYQTAGTNIDTQSNWPVAYRVSSSTAGFEPGTISGYHTAAGFVASTSIPLPTDYTQAGYEYKGWKLDGSEEIISVINKASGTIILSAVLEAGAVVVKLDRGYVPDTYTNDADADGNIPTQTSVINAKLDETVSLPDITRFGYKFTGWKVTSGSKVRDLLHVDGAETAYTIKLDDCDKQGDTTVVTVEAQWEADKFGLTLFLGVDVANDANLEISVDNGVTFHKFRELTSPDGAGFVIEQRNIKFSGTIIYGENVSDFMRRVFPDMNEGTLPILRDTSTGGTSQHFAGWTNEVGSAIDGNTKFLYGKSGMLAPGKQTLREYQLSLHEKNATIGAVWGIMSYDLTLPATMPTGWTLTYTGQEGTRHIIQEGTAVQEPIKVQQDSVVTLTTKSVNPANFSLWGFSKESGKILPNEQDFTSGDPNLVYEFAMPSEDVTATYGKRKEIWIDIARSPILFEENVMYHDRARNGFWYDSLIDGMTPLFQDETKALDGTDENNNPLSVGTYFYQWNFAEKFCVTSNGQATQNQLKLVNVMPGGVYFRDVNLTMRDAYVNDTNGNVLAGVDCESSIVLTQNNYTAQMVEDALKNVNVSDYANIIIDNTNWQTYTTSLIFRGTNNTVGAIMQDKMRVSGNYKNFLRMRGESRSGAAVNLGVAFGNFRYTVSDIQVTEYTKANLANDFKYLFYCANQTGVNISNADIEAPHKKLHAGNMTDTGETVSFTNSTVDLYSINTFRNINVVKSYLRVRENVRMGSVPIYLAENAKVVIDGNLEMAYHHWADSDAGDNRGITDDSPNNWLVVKGTFCDISNRTWRAGTLICNNLVLGRTGGIKGGTIITNQITNATVGFWKYNPNTHEYGYDPIGNSQTMAVNSYDDNYPFLTYHHKDGQMNTYTFSDGEIYLLGHYKTNGNLYDATVKATDADNPVSQFMMNASLLDANGDIVDNPSVNTNDVKAAVENSELTNNECIVLGSSSDYLITKRAVEISGNIKIYAAGNITFFNDTTVKGGTISCNGSFGSKGDLTIIDGNITATSVGNAYNLKTTLADGTIRWKRTDIQSGTVNADRIGAFEKRVNDTTPTEARQPKGTVTIAATATIEGTPTLCHDVYINYIFDKTLFNNNVTPKNATTLRFDATWQGGKTFAEQTWSSAALTFTAPNVAGGGNANWNWDNLTGHKVGGITTSGIAQNEHVELAENQKAYDRVLMKLYAVKENYDLIFKVGADQITGITCDGTTIDKTTNAAGETIAPIRAGGNVVLTFATASMAQDYSVLWYIDGSKIIHSVKPVVSGNTVSFQMPNSDVESYATTEMKLDLDITSYTLLQDGFRVEANATPTRDDSEFHYLGNLIIHQASITEPLTFDIDHFGSYQMHTPTKGRATMNKILVDDAFNNSTNNRTVTLYRIYQNGTPTSYGIEMEDGANATFLLDGAVKICRVLVPQHASFTVDGKHDDRTVDALFPSTAGDSLKGDNWASIGNWVDYAGDITLRDLTILGRAQGMMGSLSYSRKLGANTVTYDNCVYKSAQDPTEEAKYRGWYNRSYFAYRAGKVIFNNTDITLLVSKDWPGSFCDESKDVVIGNNSHIIVRDNGATETDPARPFYLRITNSLTIDDSTLDLSLRVQDESDPSTYRVYQGAGSIPKEVILSNNGKLVLEQRARLKNLVLNNSSTVKVGQTGTGYLLCENITVNDTAKLEAGGIVVAGFYNGSGEYQTEGQFQQAMREGRAILDGKPYNGLLVNGGTVSAKEYITGDVNGKIVVNGGTVNAPIIGTTGKLYGYTMYVPKPWANEKYIYTYERIPIGMNIQINGGTVNVTDPGTGKNGYLGGMKTTVEINNGNVHLAENAIVGLTDEQQTILTNDATAHGLKPANFGTLRVNGGTIEADINVATKKGGSIQMPYGTVDIQGADTGVHVYNMTASGGTMMIAGATGKAFTNPYDGDDLIQSQKQLAVRVESSMSAKELTITKGSVVYAAYAYANVPKDETGFLNVTIEGADRAYLYTTNAHGIIGEGDGSYSYNDGIPGQPGEKNVFGTKVVDVHYIIQPGNVFLAQDIGKENNPNQTNLPYYVVTDSEDPNEKYYQLEDASCSGYNFLGWYEYDPNTETLLTNRKVTRIDKSNPKDVYLGAMWEKVQVTFEIQIRVPASEYNPDTMEPVAGQEGLYRFKDKVTISYGDPILTENGIVLSNFTTNTLCFNAISYNNTPIGKETEGETIQNTRVTAQMADDFLANGTLVLMASEDSLETLNALIYLDQNKDAKGRPEGAEFPLKVETQFGNQYSDRIGAYGRITQNMGNIAAFADSTQDDGLIHPTAPGYTFEGWYTNPEFTGEKVTAATPLKALPEHHTLYAKWTPNTYKIQFSAASSASDSADGRWVTEKAIAPGTTDLSVPSMDYHWVYDTAPNAGTDCFWIIKNGVKEYKHELPKAWKEGFEFEDWYFIDETGREHIVKSEDELNKTVVENLNVGKFEGSGDETPALILYAKYKPVTVNYRLNGGEWTTAETPSNHPTYGEALPGYRKQVLASSDYDKLGITTGEDGVEYAIISTTSESFTTNSNQYVNGDYRNSIARKGYTFQGWRKDGDMTNYYGCTPRFESVTLTAEWTANTYDLELYVKDGSYTQYESEFSNPSDSPMRITGVTVNQAIPNTTWPLKNVWYAHNEGQDNSDKRRFMLGVTFAALDPGNSALTSTSPKSIYMKYAGAVTNMLHSGTMFDQGDIFFLPKDELYNLDLADATPTQTQMSHVPDYPSGSVIPMYGVYRERSLVFIEKYVDENGVVREAIMYSAPWSEYSDYPEPDNTTNGYQRDSKGHYSALTDPITGGYALAGWYVGSSDIDPFRQYTRDNYRDRIDSWKNDGSITDTYDINVYTAYVAQKTINQTLTAETTTSTSYTLPKSMQDGKLQYEMTTKASGLHLISKQDMLKHQYESQWTENGITYTADNTVAIEVTLEKDGVTIPAVALTTNDGKQALGGSYNIGKDWKITLTLYHSKAMTQENKYSFTMKYTFTNSTDTLQDQWLESHVAVNLKPSAYEVTYQANLPEPKTQLKLTENGYVETNERVYRKVVSGEKYGATLPTADETLKLEGYDRKTYWSYNQSELTDHKLTLGGISSLNTADRANELSDGKITVQVGYTPKSYTLQKDSTVEDGMWTITYGNGVDDNTTVTTLDTTADHVKYHSMVTFTPGVNQAAAYINLICKNDKGEVVETHRLDQYATEQAGQYTFPMPAYHVEVSYSNVMELYLENDTIELFEDGFIQVNPYGANKVLWPGHYRILQNKSNDDTNATKNVLKLNGNLINRTDGTGEPRTIALGNLNISNPNSIELKVDASNNGCKVNLTQEGDITAKNILVPKKTALTITGAYNKDDASLSKSITLTPEFMNTATTTAAAAIGGDSNHGTNGDIYLNNVDVKMTLQAPSTASGIGSGKQSDITDSGVVAIAGSKITVTENADTSGQYTGAWIGGAGVASVDIQYTEVLLNAIDSSNHNAKAIDGKQVSLANSQIGTDATPIGERIHADSTLTVDNSKIYQHNDHNLRAASMIGTDNGTTTIKNNSTVQISNGAGGKSDQLFTGQMVIDDAKSDVTIGGTQIVEVANGDIVMNENTVQQGTESHTHDQSLHYMILAEKSPTSASNVTVASLGEDKTITVHQPKDTSKAVTVGQLDVQDDTKLILDGDLVVGDVATVAADQTLTVAGNSHGVTYGSGLSGEGHYSQTGGSLTGNNNVVVAGNMSLTDVEADCGNFAIGSNGGNNSTATTVTIDGGSITANTIGACGVQNDTFTFVQTENTPTINGNLVQDHYRLTYDVSGLNVDLTNLPTVLRTSTPYAGVTPQTATVSDAKPANPTGADQDQFQSWFIWNADGTKRQALLHDTESLPHGLPERTLLAGNTVSRDMSAPAADGTKTLTVYAWLQASGTATIKRGRLFQSFTDGSNTTSVYSRGAWTVMLESNGTYISGRTYQATFEQALPTGTDLTLTVITPEGRTYYHYTLTQDETTVNFSSFTKMGTTGSVPPTFVDSESGQETFLLSADFTELAEGTAPVGGHVSFSVTMEDGTSIYLGDTSKVNYTVTPVVTGVINATNDTVTITTAPSGEERYNDKNVYLVGTLNKTTGTMPKVPYTATASIKASGVTTQGQWISGNMVVFDLGSYPDVTPKAYTYSFENLPADGYTIEWRLYAGDAPNVLEDPCSNTATANLTIDAQTPPMLKVTSRATSIVLAAGQTHSLTFDYETTEDAIDVTVEKQTILANFSAPAGATESVNSQAGNGTITVNIPSEAGTYRVRFSIASGSANDDVYHTFIVENK